MSVIDLDDPPCRVTLVRHARARRFTLRLDQGSDGAFLTVPPDVPERDCRAFLARHAEWLRRQMARRPPLIRVGDGIHLPVGGAPTPVRVQSGPRRVPELQDGTLVLQGPGAEGARIAAWLKMRARDSVLPAARHYARKVGRRIERIALRDTRTRWGSCSSTGTLSFSWRLAMAPPAVLDYVAAHEAAHLAIMNHSADFWALVERICPAWETHRAWLTEHGRGLHRFDFSAE